MSYKQTEKYKTCSGINTRYKMQKENAKQKPKSTALTKSCRRRAAGAQLIHGGGARPVGSGLHPVAAGHALAAALIRRWLEVCIPTLGSRTFGSSTHSRKCQLFGQQRVKLTATCISCQEPEEYLIFLVVSL